MYYPVVRWKAGEIKALENAPHHWLTDVCPIWIADGHENYQQLILGASSAWSGAQIIDMSRMHVKAISQELADNLTDSQLRLAIKLEDFDSLPGNLKESFSSAPVFISSLNESFSALAVPQDTQIGHILKSMKQPPILIIDVGYISVNRQTDSVATAGLIESIYGLGFAEVILAGGSFPITLDKYVGKHLFPRRELTFYKNVIQQTQYKVSYSDYCTLHPEWDESGVLRSNHSAIKYTIDSEWLVIRQKGKDAAALRGLAQILCLDPEFKQRTATFSWADDIWDKRGATPPQTGPGNTTNHVAEFIHHHIAQVLQRG